MCLCALFVFVLRREEGKKIVPDAPLEFMRSCESSGLVVISKRGLNGSASLNSKIAGGVCFPSYLRCNTNWKKLLLY